MQIKKLQSGQIVYDVGRHKMGNTTLSTVAVWSVRIVSVNVDTDTVMASWNSNPPKLFRERDVKRWRATKPLLVRSGLAYRLANRSETATAAGAVDPVEGSDHGLTPRD